MLGEKSNVPHVKADDIIQSIRQEPVEVDGHILPEVLLRGTTRGDLRRATMGDGSIVSALGNMDFTSGDPRAWPKFPVPDGERAVLVVSTRLALLEEYGGSSYGMQVLRSDTGSSGNIHAHVRLKSIPPGSYTVIYGGDVSFKDPPYPLVGEFENTLTARKNEMILAGRARRDSVKDPHSLK
ncbi:MAG: hypothetical protein ABIH11_00775 [Candidatus Altiarchaeota archaeon]